MPRIVRFASGSGAGSVRLGLVDEEGTLVGAFRAVYPTMGGLLRLGLAEFREAVLEAQHIGATGGERMSGTSRESFEASGRERQDVAGAERLDWRLLAPIDGETEVWAAGVTYQRSEEARVEESVTPDIYTRVYRAERPELFFKASPRRVAGPEQPVAIRADSSWNVPEPEVALVVNAHAEIVGYTIANDVSSRSIEGENPLYLPQAKVYAGCCALGPGITPAWEVTDPYDLAIRLRIERAGSVCWEDATSTAFLARRFEDLVRYLFRADEFPDGVILCTGTGLVPDPPFTLQAGDVVEIEITQLATLRNPVVTRGVR